MRKKIPKEPKKANPKRGPTHSTNGNVSAWISRASCAGSLASRNWTVLRTLRVQHVLLLWAAHNTGQARLIKMSTGGRVLTTARAQEDLCMMAYVFERFSYYVIILFARLSILLMFRDRPDSANGSYG